MSAISAIYFLDRKGRIIIFRNYRGEVDQDISEGFINEVLELDEANMKPAFTIDNVHYIWIRHQNIYIVAVGKRNINVAMTFSFLYKLKDILIDYFNVLEEETVKDNFVLIYELLDEIMDHGYPQITEGKILKDLIMISSNKKNNKTSKENLALTSTMTNTVSWRKEGIKYNINEAWLDVIEKVDELISSNGNVLSSQINGNVIMKNFLSGMPTVTVGLNDKIVLQNLGKDTTNSVEMDDLKFHQCVNKKKFENERIIEFIPPDGEFELMSYRLDIQIKPLISVKVNINTISETRIEYVAKAKTNFKNRSVANNVSIYIPVPLDIQNATFKTTSGSVVYLSDREDLLWFIKRFEGQTELDMNCSFQVPTVRIDDTTKHLKRPIQVSFEIPYFTVSGFQVRYMKIVEKSGYEAVPWVRYFTKNGEYNIRII
jgi:AP-1 complex subunit mu